MSPTRFRPRDTPAGPQSPSLERGDVCIGDGPKAYASELKRQAADLAQTEWTTLLAEVDGLAVGYAQSLPREAPVPLDPGPVRYLRRLYLEQAWTGRGVGRPLLSAIAADARDRGVATLWLNTWERATHAIAFYRKQGFAEVGTMTFMVGNDPQRDLVFALRL